MVRLEICVSEPKCGKYVFVAFRLESDNNTVSLLVLFVSAFEGEFQAVL